MSIEQIESQLKTNWHVLVTDANSPLYIIQLLNSFDASIRVLFTTDSLASYYYSIIPRRELSNVILSSYGEVNRKIFANTMSTEQLWICTDVHLQTVEQQMAINWMNDKTRMILLGSYQTILTGYALDSVAVVNRFTEQAINPINIGNADRLMSLITPDQDYLIWVSDDKTANNYLQYFRRTSMRDRPVTILNESNPIALEAGNYIAIANEEFMPHIFHNISVVIDTGVHVGRRLTLSGAEIITRKRSSQLLVRSHLPSNDSKCNAASCEQWYLMGDYKSLARSITPQSSNVNIQGYVNQLMQMNIEPSEIFPQLGNDTTVRYITLYKSLSNKELTITNKYPNSSPEAALFFSRWRRQWPIFPGAVITTLINVLSIHDSPRKLVSYLLDFVSAINHFCRIYYYQHELSDWLSDKDVNRKQYTVLFNRWFNELYRLLDSIRGQDIQIGTFDVTRVINEAVPILLDIFQVNSDNNIVLVADNKPILYQPNEIVVKEQAQTVPSVSKFRTTIEAITDEISEGNHPPDLLYTSKVETSLYKNLMYKVSSRKHNAKSVIVPNEMLYTELSSMSDDRVSEIREYWKQRPEETYHMLNTLLDDYLINYNKLNDINIAIIWWYHDRVITSEYNEYWYMAWTLAMPIPAKIIDKGATHPLMYSKRPLPLSYFIDDEKLPIHDVFGLGTRLKQYRDANIEYHIELMKDVNYHIVFAPSFNDNEDDIKEKIEILFEDLEGEHVIQLIGSTTVIGNMFKLIRDKATISKIPGLNVVRYGTENDNKYKSGRFSNNLRLNSSYYRISI